MSSQIRQSSNEIIALDPFETHSIESVKTDSKCFGKLWTLSAKECIECSLETFCGNICSKTHLAITLEPLPFDLNKLNKNWLEDLEFEIINGKTEISEIFSLIHFYTNIKDIELIKELLKLFLFEKNYKIQGNNLVKIYEQDFNNI